MRWKNVIYKVLLSEAKNCVVLILYPPINRKHSVWKSIKKILIYQVRKWHFKTWFTHSWFFLFAWNTILKMLSRDLKRKTNNPTHVLHFSYYKKHLWPLWFEFQFRRHKCFRKLNWYRGLDKDRRSKMWQVQLHNESPPLW